MVVQHEVMDGESPSPSPSPSPSSPPNLVVVVVIVVVGGGIGVGVGVDAGSTSTSLRSVRWYSRSLRNLASLALFFAHLARHLLHATSFVFLLLKVELGAFLSRLSSATLLQPPRLFPRFRRLSSSLAAPLARA